MPLYKWNDILKNDHYRNYLLFHTPLLNKQNNVDTAVIFNTSINPILPLFLVSSFLVWMTWLGWRVLDSRIKCPLQEVMLSTSVDFSGPGLIHDMDYYTRSDQQVAIMQDRPVEFCTISYRAISLTSAINLVVRMEIKIQFIYCACFVYPAQPQITSGKNQKAILKNA